jgi:predicted RNA-binding Zn-ribbon protein involved in translation (DUF1610 family)
MAECISCRIEVESKEMDAGNRLLLNCKKCGTYDISRPAISRVKRNRADMRRFVTALSRARKNSKILSVMVLPRIGIKFEVGGEAPSQSG